MFNFLKTKKTSFVREIEENKLRKIFGINRFYDKQWKTICELYKGKKVLLIEKTGFGKSLCFEYLATQFKGITVVFSPLIGLMRNQLNYLKSLGIKAESINSEQTYQFNMDTISKIKNNKLKIVFIAPERIGNIDWMNEVKNFNISFIVIDEVHCISIWGYDFRPDYRKIVKMIEFLPENIPVLATTATVNKMIKKDIIKQIKGKHVIIKGNLSRENFYLNVVKVKDEYAKMAWLPDFINKQDGTGIVFTGTRFNTKLYSDWLNFLGFSTTRYNSALIPELRKKIEDGFIENKWKCIVSTNALGIGFDKNDIRFIVHTQIPQSIVHYYQEIGRAGRDGKSANIVLLFNPDDIGLPEFFINIAHPDIKFYDRVIEEIVRHPASLVELLERTNLTETQVRIILSDLIDQNVILEKITDSIKIYYYNSDADFFSVKHIYKLIKYRWKELKQMINYVHTSMCRMNYLCNFFGDYHFKKCGICDNDLKIKHNSFFDDYWKEKIQLFFESNFPELEVSSDSSNLINGIAGSYYGFRDIGKIISNCKYRDGGDFPARLVDLTLKAFNSKFNSSDFDFILYVPPSISGDLVKNFAQKFSNAVGIPVSHNLKLKKSGSTKPQKKLKSIYLKSKNVKDRFYLENQSEIPGLSILLIDYF